MKTLTLFFSLLLTAAVCSANPGTLVYQDSLTDKAVPSEQPQPQQQVTLRLGGTAQVRASFANDQLDRQERFGFGIRRLRLRLYANIGSQFRLFAQGEGAGNDLGILDLRLAYAPNPNIEFRLGRMILAQPAAFGLTAHYHIDAIDRPVIAAEWARHTVGADGRDFGLETRLTSDRFLLQLALHNGDGNWDRVRGNFREDIGLGSPTRNVDQTGLALSSALTYRSEQIPRLEVGGFLGFNTARNPNTNYEETGRNYRTYAAHVYWGRLPGSQPFRVKADLVGIHYDTVPVANTLDTIRYEQRTLGVSLLGAAQVRTGRDVFARIEHYDANVHALRQSSQFVTVGFSFSPSAVRGNPYQEERLTLGWTTRFGSGSSMEAYSLVLQAQVVF